ncbi:hypothetical protein BV25DRAFT_1822035 [Artomyces pyxidatus]|uniref:Uncharacterized protein n=1 Tax=Artomyces pyxidatus TaxID=48021 RepID=A0ACB8TBM5_9AGAM|nr:hypothetical protein BV25DRAFT_1822035 [Artomyces pyxidatus]
MIARKSRITARGVLASLTAILWAFTAAFDVVNLWDAIATPSPLVPARSELAVCGSLVLWRLVWHFLSTANYLPFVLLIIVPALQPSSRTRIPCVFALCTWVPLGLVLLSASRACEAAAPHAWEGATIRA